MRIVIPARRDASDHRRTTKAVSSPVPIGPVHKPDPIPYQA